MTERQAEKHTRYFSQGVKAHILCYAGSGNWAISIDRESGVTTFYEVDELKRCVAELQKALSFVQSQSSEDSWRDAPVDPFTGFGERGLESNGGVK